MEEDYEYKTTLDKLISQAPAISVDSLFTDSRKVVENGIFFCVKGLVNDGHNYAKNAVANGAVCVVHCEDLNYYAKDVYYLKVDDVLDSLNEIAAKFYDNPSQKLKVFAVTGTNGKTTVSSLLKSILDKFEKTGYIGTINIQYDNKTITADYTTPDVIELQSVLAKMVLANVKSLAIEVSSHSLEQKRVNALETDFAIFCNLTHDHLDYHGDMENYFLAKSKLFSNLKPYQVAIINIDDEWGLPMLEKSSGKNITYAIEKPADYQAVDIEYFKDKTLFNLIYENKTYPIVTNLVAKFNVYNLLSVIAALKESGIAIESIIENLRDLSQVDGRVERIDLGQNFIVIVDYAHTPDGFEKIFAYADEIKNDKRIIAVFGSAGERDIAKRKMLGEIANRYCDMIILTEDDPRNEDVREISNKIAEGITKNYVIIENRYDAIYQAVELANEDDIILLLGKGNDQYMAKAHGREYYLGDGQIVKGIIQEYIIDYQEEEFYE